MQPSADLKTSRRLVVKIGSALLVDQTAQQVNLPWLVSLIDDVSQLAHKGVDVVLVSSGAIALGQIHLGLAQQLTLDKQQAAAAVGQIHLAHTYQSLLHQQGLTAALILLTLADSENRRRSLNSRNTIESLLKLNVIPIINENDTVATNEMRFGDNDRLSARVAQMINADTLVLLSDIDGLYTQDPHLNPQAQHIPLVTELTSEILASATDSSTHVGSGGMITKLAAAKIAMNSGCRMLITQGQPHHPLQQFMATQRGTWFLPKTSPVGAKKAWLQEHLRPFGKLVIDAGAVSALHQGRSLLPVGIVQFEGHFQKGDPVSIVDTKQVEIGRGLCNYAAVEVDKIKGQSTANIQSLLGYNGCHEVIHRDNLVLLTSGT